MASHVAVIASVQGGQKTQRQGIVPHRRRGIAVAPGRVLGAMALAVGLAFMAPMAYAAERISICYGSVSSALVPLAKLQGFFDAEGLDVELRRSPSGKQALDKMLSGECALATAGDIPVVHNSFQRGDFSIVAEIAEYRDFERLVVRSDRGVLTPGDLRGRRVGVAEFTGGHYFLDIFLTAHNLARQDVIKVYLPSERLAQAFRQGEVDAVAHWEPMLQILAKEFGQKAKIFTAPGLRVAPFLLVGQRDFVRKNPVIIERVLRALVGAEGFARKQPAKAKALMAAHYAIEPGELNLIWPMQEFRLSLAQTLPFMLESAARWEIGLLPAAQRPAMPNYLDFVCVDGLLAAKPTAVTIIH